MFLSLHAYLIKKKTFHIRTIKYFDMFEEAAIIWVGRIKTNNHILCYDLTVPFKHVKRPLSENIKFTF